MPDVPDQSTRLQFDGSRLDAVIDSAVGERRLVGTVVLVARDGKEVYRRAAGFADRETATPMQVDSVFRLASITKPIVSAAALKLVEKRAISLDDKATRWLPDFKPKLADGSSPDISIHHLLTHTAGLSYCFLEPAGSAYHALDVSDGLAHPDRGLAENLALLEKAPLAYRPGEGWRYSLALDVLGAIIERVAGGPLPDVVARLILDPLGMSSCGFYADETVGLVTPYVDGSPEPAPMHDGVEVRMPAGVAVFAPSRARSRAAYASGGAGMIGSAPDIVRFLEVIRQGGRPILGEPAVRTMMGDHVGPAAQTQGPGWGFGYGWAVLADPTIAATPQNPGTIQWGGAYGHGWFVDRQAGLTLVALTNTALEGVSGAFRRQIRDAAYGL